MRTLPADLWELHRQGYWAVVPTNLQVRKTGTAIMGAGLARQAADRFPGLDRIYGAHLILGRRYLIDHEYRLLLVPTKEHWKDPSPLRLIRYGCLWLAETLPQLPSSVMIAVPLLGCGLGQLSWEHDVRPVMEELLTDDRFVVVRPLG